MSSSRYSSIQPSPYSKSYLNFPTINDPFTPRGSVRAKDSKIIQKSFLERNYTCAVTKSRKMTYYKPMSQSELNSLFYMMKHYFNEINSQTCKNDTLIKNMKEKNIILSKNIEFIESSKEININGEEKISIVGAKEEPKIIGEKLSKLEREKNEVASKSMNEGEYATTIKHMIETVRAQLHKIDEETIITKQKINDLKLAQKTLTENRNIKLKERNESEVLLFSIQNEIDRYNQLIYEQEMKKEKLDKKTEKKEKKIEYLREKIKLESKIKKEEIEKKKSETLQKIRDYQYKKEKKKEKENEYINLILGLHFFQKNIIETDKNQKDLNTKEIQKSNDYKNLMGKEHFSVIDDLEDSKVINTDNNIMTTSSNKHKKKGKRTKIPLSEIKKKFEEINLTFDEVYNYYIKMISAENFARKTMINLNNKQIELEKKKDIFSKKVTEIINKDYKNFEDLIKNNPRFKDFIENNNIKMKKAHIIRTNKYNNQVTDLLTEEDKNHPDKKEIERTSNIFIVKCNKAKTDILYYIESMLSSMKAGNYFKELDDLEEENDENIPVYHEFLENSKELYNLYNHIEKEQYLKDILKFAISKGIDNAVNVYTILFEMPKSKIYLNQFLKKEILCDPFIYYNFSDIEKRKLLIQLIERILNFYSPYLKHITLQEEVLQTFGTRSSKTGPLISDEGNSRRLQIRKKTSTDNVLIPNSTKSKKTSSNQALFYKSLVEKDKTSSNNIENARTPTLEEEINNEYNYSMSDSDEMNEKQNASHSRPMTSSTLSSNSSLMQKLYKPSLQKNYYLRKLRSGMGRILKNTSQSKAAELNFRRSWRDVDELKNYFFVYNDPSKFFILYFRNQRKSPFM